MIKKIKNQINWEYSIKKKLNYFDLKDENLNNPINRENKFLSWNIEKIPEDSDIKRYKTRKEIEKRAKEIICKVKKNNIIDKFQKHVLESKTFKDKLDTWTFLIQKNPLEYYSYIKIILDIVDKKKYREKELALDNLVKIFSSNIMPNQILIDLSKRKYKKKIDDKTVLLWFIEDQFKKLYNDLINKLEESLMSHMKWFRVKSINWVYALLERNSEKKTLLLMLLIYKFGDNDNQVASLALKCMQKLIRKYSTIRILVAKEVSNFLKRNKNTRAKKYSLVLLSEFKYYKINKDNKISSVCIQIFLKYLKENLNKKNSTNKILNVILIGLRRAFPYTRMNKEVFKSFLHRLYEINKIYSYSISVNSLLLIYQIENSNKIVSDRLFCSIYNFLIRIKLNNFSKSYQLFHLLDITIKNDCNEYRITAFVKRMFQLVIHYSSNFGCRMLLLISKILKINSKVCQLFILTDEEAKLKMLNCDKSKNKLIKKYDIHKSSFKYRKVMRFAMWEISIILCHYHPSAHLWINMIINSKSIYYNGNPLIDYSTIAFLNYFNCKIKKKIQIF